MAKQALDGNRLSGVAMAPRGLNTVLEATTERVDTVIASATTESLTLTLTKDEALSIAHLFGILSLGADSLTPERAYDDIADAIEESGMIGTETIYRATAERFNFSIRLIPQEFHSGSWENLPEAETVENRRTITTPYSA